MGIGPFRRDDGFYYGDSIPPPPINIPSHVGEAKKQVSARQAPTSGNPNPLNYEILRSQQVGRHLVVEVKYPDCTNYEGRKIMVYQNLTISGLVSQKEVDPHFSKSNKFRSPIARLEPTDHGWKLAIALAKMDL